MSTTVESLELKIYSDSTKAAQGIDALTQSLTKLKNATKNGLGLSSTSKDIGGLSTSIKKSSFSFTDLYHKVGAIVKAFKVAGQAIKSLTDKSSAYNEVVNLFSISMGQYAESAYNYASKVSDVMGIDPSEWMKSQGVFMTLATGFGVAGDRASKMSEQLTQLGYDISSFQDISVEEAMQKLQSGLAGELEPLRRIGYDLSQAKLEATALELGIDKSVSSMTQAEKAQLRYYAIMTQVTQQQGDMARTLEDPANQMRILKAQFEVTARSVGNIFIPALQAILPYATAVTKIIGELAQSIASFVGYKPPEVKSSGIDSISGAAESTSGAMDDAAASAKKLKSYMLGFDELNVISPDTSEAVDDLTSGGFDFELPEYDFLGGASNEKVEGIVSKIKEMMQPLKDLVDTTVEWAKALDLKPMEKSLKKIGSSIERVGTKIGEVFGWVYTEVLLPVAEWAIENGIPAALDAISSALDSVYESMTPVFEGIKEIKPVLEPIATWIGDVFIMVINAIRDTFDKLAQVFNDKGETIKGIITGLGEIISVVWSILKPILDVIVPWVKTAFAFISDLLAEQVKYIIDVISGIVNFVAGVFTGDWDRAWKGIGEVFNANWEHIKNVVVLAWNFIGDTIVAAWDAIVALFSSVGKWFYDVVIVPVGDFFKGLWETVAGFFVSLWNDIVGVWNTVATWFDENVIQPIVKFFEPIANTISQIFEGCWIVIQAVWVVVSTWFNDNVITPVVDFFKGVWESVSGFFTNLWNDIKKVWESVSTWFNDTVVVPVVDFFKGIWTSVSGFFSSLWEDIKEVWNAVSTWFNDTIVEPVKTVFKDACEAIGKFFSDLWLSIRQGVVGAMNGVIGGIESAINWVVGGINNLIGGFNKVVQWAADVIGADWGGVTLLQEVKFNRIAVPTYAEGGFPEQGQMFVAREAGAEMVGNIGRRTAVANNDQIVASISGGVAQANEEQNTLLREQNSLLRALLEKDSGVYLDGKNLTNSVEKYQRERGRVLITGGVV